MSEGSLGYSKTLGKNADIGCDFCGRQTYTMYYFENVKLCPNCFQEKGMPAGAQVVNSVPKQAEHDPVNHPKHYTSHPSGIECIEITRHMSFNIGNAVKYLWRADEKGAPIEDLKKAVWYINDEIARRQHGKKETKERRD